MYPKKHLGHAVNIRFNSTKNAVDFVDDHGDIVDFIRDGSGKEFLWTEFDFSEMDQFFLYTYVNGAIEWGIVKKKTV